jgi:hypothetical protein
MDAFHVDELVSALLVRDEDKFHRPFRRGEGGCVRIGLFVCRDKSHVSGWDLDECFQIGVASYRC